VGPQRREENEGRNVNGRKEGRDRGTRGRTSGKGMKEGGEKERRGKFHPYNSLQKSAPMVQSMVSKAYHKHIITFSNE